MDNNIQIFNNEELGTIRIMGTPDAPLFCLGDVCKMLGLRQGHVRERLDDGVFQPNPSSTVLEESKLQTSLQKMDCMMSSLTAESPRQRDSANG